jgi:hypothetical protein
MTASRLIDVAATCSAWLDHHTSTTLAATLVEMHRQNETTGLSDGDIEYWLSRLTDTLRAVQQEETR